jgi:hypothetical protein
VSQIPLAERYLRRWKQNAQPGGWALKEKPRFHGAKRNGSGGWIRTNDNEGISCVDGEQCSHIGSHESGIVPPELQEVCAAWADLPDSLRNAILGIVRSVNGGGQQ